MPRTRTFTISTLTAVVFAACLAWSGSVEPIHAKAQIPFRLMEATISETQAALQAGTVTSEDLVNMYLARSAAFDDQGPAINAMVRMNPNTSTRRARSMQSVFWGTRADRSTAYQSC
jgi:hypothetical protein